MTHLSEAAMQAGFGEQGADWQENDNGWMYHYTSSPLHTHAVLQHSVAPFPRKYMYFTNTCVKIHVLCGRFVFFGCFAFIQMSLLHRLNN